MKVKYLAKSALLALLTLAFILPTVACGGGEDASDASGGGGEAEAEAEAELYSLKDAKWVGFKETENITAAHDYEGLQEAWDGSIWYSPGSPLKMARRERVKTIIHIWVFESAISESLKAEIQSAGVAEGLHSLFLDPNIVVRCEDKNEEGEAIPAEACQYFIDRMTVEEDSGKGH